MVGKFFKNVTYMSFGNLFQIFIALLSTAIYVRVIGVSGYAIIGIVFSLYNIILRLDIPFSLTLVKHNSDYYRKRKKEFENMFSTLYNSILLSNVIIFPLLFFLVVFLSTGIYNNKSLLPFYLIAILILTITRINTFLKHFLRANKHEVPIQKSYIPSLTAEFLLVLTLLFVFKLGIIAIFIGTLVRQILEYSLLSHYLKPLIKYRLYFSFSFFIKTFREHIFHNYIQSMLYDLMLYGGLFVSTFYLDITSIGVLTIIISILSKVKELFFPISFHIRPVYSHAILNKMHNKLKDIMKNTTSLLLLFNTIIMIFLLLIGKPLYSLYFGGKMNGTYLLFLLMMSGNILAISLTTINNYFFVSDIKLLNKINIILIAIFFVMLVPAIKSLTIFGIVLTFFVVNTLRLPITYFFLHTEYQKMIDKNILVLFIILVSSITLTILTHGTTLNLIPIIFVSIFILSSVLLLNTKKIVKMIKFVIFEI